MPIQGKYVRVMDMGATRVQSRNKLITLDKS